MKRFLTLVLIVLVTLCALFGCGSSGEVIDYDLVFVNDSDAVIVEVVMNFADQTSGSRRADGRPMKRGETFGFEAGRYPVTVAVYDSVAGDFIEGALARITVDKAPPEGERWYVTAKDRAGCLVLTVDTQKPWGA